MKNYSLKCLASLFAAMLVATTANADVLSPEQAFARATSSAQAPSKLKALSQRSDVKPVFIQKDAKNQPSVYLFNLDDNGAFILASADDIVPALLGYGDDGLVASDELNPEFSWWIAEYGRQIEWARENGVTSSQRTLSPSFAAIQPMVKTKWNQNAPYNNLCPKIDGKATYTGCVATALSQVMNYYQWPPTGEGTKTYTPTNVGSEITVNFADTTFDWSEMLDEYDASATTAQQNAVATLMYNVGVGVEMDYGTSSSGATDYNAAKGLTNYFRYQPGICYYQRDYYPINQWEELVYNQLQNGPLYYSGSSNTSGHAFVCDGYNGTGYFHINWGWGGTSDGYFLLSALDPPSQGIGGSSSGYNFGQGILGNMKPLKDGSDVQTVVPYFYCNQYDITPDTTTLGSRVTVTGGIYNATAPSYTGQLGMKIVASDGTVTYAKGSTFTALEMLYGYKSYSIVLPSSLAEGTYSVSPVIGDGNGNWYDAGMANGIERTNKMTVSSNRDVTFSSVEAAQLTVNNLTANTPFYLGSYFGLSFTIENNSDNDYTGSIRPAFVNSSNSAVAYGAQYPVYLASGESVDITDYTSSWYLPSGSSAPAAGTYTLVLIDDQGYVISNELSVNVNAASTPTVSFGKLAPVGYEPMKGYTNLYELPKDDLNFEAEITCTSGYFANGVTLYFFPYVPGSSVSSVASFPSDVVYLEAGQSETLKFNCTFNDGEVGSTYFCEMNYGSGWVGNEVIFILTEPLNTGVEDVIADPEYVSVEYFNLNGVKVCETNLRPGLYIVRRIASDGSITTTKQIVR